MEEKQNKSSQLGFLRSAGSFGSLTDFASGKDDKVSVSKVDKPEPKKPSSKEKATVKREKPVDETPVVKKTKSSMPTALERGFRTVSLSQELYSTLCAAQMFYLSTEGHKPSISELFLKFFQESKDAEAIMKMKEALKL